MTRVVVQRGQSSSSSRAASSIGSQGGGGGGHQHSSSNQPSTNAQTSSSSASNTEDDFREQKEIDVLPVDNILISGNKPLEKDNEYIVQEGGSSFNVNSVLDDVETELLEGNRAGQFSIQNAKPARSGDHNSSGLSIEHGPSQSEHVAIHKLLLDEDKQESKQESVPLDGANSGVGGVSGFSGGGNESVIASQSNQHWSGTEFGPKLSDTSIHMPLPSYPTSSGSHPFKRGTWTGPIASSGARAPVGTSRKAWRGSKPSKSPPGNSRSSSPRSFVEADGYNSADEQNPWTHMQRGFEYDDDKESQFEIEIRRTKGLEVRRMAEDGNCLFRAVADQVYGDPEMHGETRQMCIDYMEKERDHFSQFVTESFSAYCKRKRRDKAFGNNLEIQAMAEMYNRPIHIYSYSTEPKNTFHGNYETDLPPIRLSYHRGNHYNSLVDPGRPTIGAGLGFGSLRGGNVDREQVKAAIKAQQDFQIDKALVAEGRFYSDLELTEQEMERMVIEASRAEFLAEEYGYQIGCEESSTSAAGTSTSQGAAYDNQLLPPWHNSSETSIGPSPPTTPLTPNMRTLLSMGFSYIRVLEACNIFGDDINDMLCYLLETDNGGLFEDSTYRLKGKAAEKQ